MVESITLIMLHEILTYLLEHPEHEPMPHRECRSLMSKMVPVAAEVSSVWMVTRVSYQVKLCQRRGTGWPAFGPVLMKPLAQGDAVVFIFSTASLSLCFC